MYKISIFNGGIETVIHYPDTNDLTPHVLSAPYLYKLSQSANVTIQIPYGNPGFGNIFPYKTLITITDLRDGEIVFEGRAVYPRNTMSQDGMHYAEWIFEDDLSYLNDTNVRAWILNDIPVMNFLQQVINNHNYLCDAEKQFTLGNIEITGNVTYNTNFETSLGVIMDQLVNKLGGDIQVRKQDGVRYLDYVNSVGITNTTVIALSKNMLDMILEQDDTTQFATRIVPVGKDNLSIASVNGNVDYVQDANAVSEFGIIEKVVQYNDITDATQLLVKAMQDLPTYTQVLNKFEATAADLNKLNINIESFGLGDDVPVTNPLFGMQQEMYRIIEISGDFLQPQSPKLTFANRIGRMTVRMQQIQIVSNVIQGLLSSNNQLSTFFLDGTINSLQNKIVASGAYQHAQVLENGGSLYENTDPTSPDYGALYLGPGIMAIANSKIDDAWNFRTFGTGSGFVADMITTGILNANLIKTGKIASVDGSFVLDIDNGLLTTYATDNGFKALEFENRTIKGFDFLNSGQQIWQLETERTTGTPSIPSAVLGIAQGAYFAVADMENPLKNYLLKLENGVTPSVRKGQMNLSEFLITSYASTGGVRVSTDSLGDTALTTYGNVDMNGWSIDNLNQVHGEVYFDGVHFKVNPANNGGGCDFNDGGIDFYRNVWHHNWDVHDISNLYCANLAVSGSKNCVHDTKNFGKRMFTAIESDETYLCRKFFGKTVDGVALIYLDGPLQECVNSDIAYHAELTPYDVSYNQCNPKIERHPGYVIVTTDVDTEFSLTVYAKRRGFENHHLEEYKDVKSTLANKDIQEPLDQNLSVIEDFKTLNGTLDQPLDNNLASILLSDLNLGTKLLEV